MLNRASSNDAEKLKAAFDELCLRLCVCMLCMSVFACVCLCARVCVRYLTMSNLTTLLLCLTDGCCYRGLQTCTESGRAQSCCYSGAAMNSLFFFTEYIKNKRPHVLMHIHSHGVCLCTYTLCAFAQTRTHVHTRILTQAQTHIRTM